MAVALRVENLSKQYRIYGCPTDRLKESLTRGRLKRHREFWALSDISFELERGTTTGIIGPNGCGKSTLLQIIAGTLNPTSGSVWHEGRIAALLELGAGFNPEFTGIENTFMNATLLGLSHSETESLLPEIERFAEIGEFIHQPVKTYSSGMYIRLAFAIATSANPQILIVDEALSVGDAVFQHRCVRRIKQMQENGATILFVSHDPSAIRALCSQGILLNKGRMVAKGKPLDVVNRYQKIIMSCEETYEQETSNADELEDIITPPTIDAGDAGLTPSYRHGNGVAEIVSVEILDAMRRRVEIVESGDELMVRVRAVFHRDVDDPVCGFLIRNRHGIHTYGTNTDLQQLELGEFKAGDVLEVAFAFNCWLGADKYSVTVAVHSRGGISFDWIDDPVFFRVMSARPMEGLANLNASATTRRLNRRPQQEQQQQHANV